MLEYVEEDGDVVIFWKVHQQEASKFCKRNDTVQYVEGWLDANLPTNRWKEYILAFNVTYSRERGNLKGGLMLCKLY